MLQRTAKSCGPDAPTLASSSRRQVGSTGLRHAISVGDGGKQAWSPGRARRKPLKPLRAGTSGDPGYSLLLVCVLPLPSAHEAAGAAGIRRSPRPLRGGGSSNASGASRCEGEGVSGIRGTSLALPATMSAQPGRKRMAPAPGPEHQRRAPHFPPDMSQFRRPGRGLSRTAIFLLRTGWPML
jgi:hypothetical protein